MTSAGANASGKPLSIYVIAGEASGDLLGAHLMRSLQARSKQPIKFYGVGGELMMEAGIKSIFPYYELARLGFIEILPYLFNITARISLTVDDIIAKAPDVVITVDVPGFSRRVVKKLRDHGVKTKFVHYVAPTVWVYNPERAQLWATLFDHLLVLLPFEPPYFEKVGLPCTFVGHPVVAETKAGDGAAFRKKYDIADDTMLFTLLPGSRKGEVERHMPIFARAVTLLATRYPNLTMVVAVPRNVLPIVAEYFEGCPFRAIITANNQDKKDAVAASNLSIVKSGTVTLEVAMAGTPMVVAYRVHPLSAWALKRIILTKFVNIINILLGKEAVPELLQDLCSPLMIATAAAQLLQYPERQTQQKKLSQTALKQLLPPGDLSPSDMAADVVLALIDR